MRAARTAALLFAQATLSSPPQARTTLGTSQPAVVGAAAHDVPTRKLKPRAQVARAVFQYRIQ